MCPDPIDPNIGLPNPVPGITVGFPSNPNWASELEAFITKLAAMTHTGAPNDGQQIPTAGININADLSFNTLYNLSSVRAVQFANQTSTLTSPGDVNCLYFDGSNFWCNNGAGQAIQITAGGNLNAAALSINTYPTQVISSSPWTVLGTDLYAFMEVNTTNARTINLCAANAVAPGRFFIIKDTTGTANSHNITINRAGSNTIQGNISYTINTNYGFVILASDGSSKWAIIGNDTPTLAGDVTGPSNSNTVTKLQGNPVQSGILGSAQDGYVLTWNNTNNEWEPRIQGSEGLTPLAFPPVVPITGDNYFGVFLWHFASDNSDNVLASDSTMQAFVNGCGTRGINIVFFGVEPYLLPSRYLLANEQAINKLVHCLHESGIEVHALMGQGSNGDGYARNPGTGSNFIGYGQAQQWYLQNIVEPVRQYNVRAPSSKYPNSKFDGFCTDSEYFNNGPSFYTTVEAEGGISNMNITKSLLPDIKCGITVNWTVMPQNNAYVYRGGDGYYGSEGCHMINAPGCDYIIVQAYRNTSANQIPLFDPFYQATNNSTSTSIRIRTNVPLFLASSCESDITASHSYYTGSAGALATMLSNLTTISQTYGGYNAPIIWQGHVIEQWYDQFATMQ